MRVDLLARRWGSAEGGPDGMAIAASFLAWTLCELGHEVRGHGSPGQRLPWKHDRFSFALNVPPEAPVLWDSDLVISTISPVWRRTVAAADKAGALSRLAYWHHHGSPPPGFGAVLLSPPGVVPSAAWARVVTLPPSSWAAERGGVATGDEIVVPGASGLKGGGVAAEVARLSPDFRFFVLPGRSANSELARWRVLPNATVAAGSETPESWLARARAVLCPTRAEVYPLALLEAASRGIPVVCSDMIGTREATGGLASYLPVDAPPSIWADALRNALASRPPFFLRRPYPEIVTLALAAMLGPQTTAAA